MQELLQHIISPFISSPDDMKVDIQEVEASHIITLELTEADAQVLKANDDEALRNIRHILSIASGSKKAILRLKGPEVSSDADDFDDSATAD